ARPVEDGDRVVGLVGHDDIGVAVAVHVPEGHADRLAADADGRGRGGAVDGLAGGVQPGGQVDGNVVGVFGADDQVGQAVAGEVGHGSAVGGGAGAGDGKGGGSPQRAVAVARKQRHVAGGRVGRHHVHVPVLVGVGHGQGGWGPVHGVGRGRRERG